ncbi:MAG: hypothetical protein E7302_08460 [Butyrivibrio sp.]|nr:hypothetical protein [Butyrivibrio sp.]
MKSELKSKYINVALNVLLMFAIIILCPILASAEDGYTEIYFDKKQLMPVPYYDGQFYDGMKFVIVDKNDHAKRDGSSTLGSNSRMYYTVISAANRQLCLDKISGLTHNDNVDGGDKAFDISKVVYISGPYVSGNYTIEKIIKLDCRKIWCVYLEGFEGHEFSSNMFVCSANNPKRIVFGEYGYDSHLKDDRSGRAEGTIYDGEELLSDLQFFVPGLLNGCNPEKLIINFGGKTIPSNLLKNCKRLKMLEFYAWNLKTLPKGFFKTCSNLEELDIDIEKCKKLNQDFSSNKKLYQIAVGVQQIDKNTFKGAKNVYSIKLWLGVVWTIKKDSFKFTKAKTVNIQGDDERSQLKNVEKGAFNGIETIWYRNLRASEKKLLKGKGCKRIKKWN